MRDLKYCPKCNKEYESDAAQFCNICGTALVDKSNGANNNIGNGMCPSCGKHVPADQCYCSFCGADLKANKKENEADNNKKDSNSKTILIVIIVAVVAVIVAIGIRVYTMYFKKDLEKDLDPTQSVVEQQTSEMDNNQVDIDVETDIDNSTNTHFDSTTDVVTSTPPSTTIDEMQAMDIPPELQKYANGLMYEGRTYRITLQEDDWYINYRSEPVYIDIKASNSNVVGKIQSGTEIYVEYIYDETWAVFFKDGRYVFSSLYGSNDPTHNKLMEPNNG